MRVLVMTSRMPSPLDTGDRLRIYHQLKILSQHHKTSLFFITDSNPKLEEIQHLESIVDEVKYSVISTSSRLFSMIKNSVFGKLPFQVSYFYDSDVKNEFYNYYKTLSPDKVYYQLARTAPYLIEKENSIIDLMDAFSYGAKLNAMYCKFFLKKIFWNIEARKMKKYEIDIANKFQYLTIISSKEKSRLPHIQYPMIVVQNGVNLPDKALKNEKYDIGFVGNMKYPPNYEAYQYIRERILPLYTQKYSQSLATLIAGKDSDSLKNGDNVTLGGWYNDINTAYQSMSVFVAPMYMGMGQQNKILEAIANYTPVICSERIAQAFELKKGVHLITADSPIEYVDAIHRVLNNDMSEMTNRAFQHISENYTWSKATSGLLKLMD